MRNQMLERREYCLEAPEANSETFTCPQLPQTPRKKKNKIKNKRRFSDEQIKLLESIFESETKLEPRKKLQVARELELQPRQVAIWFQNRRARWKSKQIEQEYRTLRGNYDNLASRFESLKKEKQSLLLQLQKISEMLGKPYDKDKDSKGLEASSTDGGSDHGHMKSEPEAKPSSSQEGLEHRGFMCSHNHNSRDIEQLGEERHEHLNMGEYIDGSLASPEKWYSIQVAYPICHVAVHTG